MACLKIDRCCRERWCGGGCCCNLLAAGALQVRATCSTYQCASAKVGLSRKLRILKMFYWLGPRAHDWNWWRYYKPTHCSMVLSEIIFSSLWGYSRATVKSITNLPHTSPSVLLQTDQIWTYQFHHRRTTVQRSGQWRICKGLNNTVPVTDEKRSARGKRRIILHDAHVQSDSTHIQKLGQLFPRPRSSHCPRLDNILWYSDIAVYVAM